VDLPRPGPVARKLGHDRSATTRSALSEAHDSWLAALRSTTLGGLVLDYDGTCCETWDRFEPPAPEVQAGLLRLLDGGMVIGFASGRGRSLHDTTRAWLPERHWGGVITGLYNGSTILRLSDAPPVRGECEGDLREAAERIESLGLANLIVERRPFQVSVSSSTAGDPSQRLRDLVQAIIDRPPSLGCKAVASGHSVDVIGDDSSKVSVVSAVQAESSNAVLVVGDQGQLGGNDFELLSSTPLSLSVDRCSLDPGRCWNLDVRGERGAVLLARYLRHIEPRASGFKFTWPKR
jgi:hypothetical protein